MRESLTSDEVRSRSSKASENIVEWIRRRGLKDGVIGLYRTRDPNRDGEIDPIGIEIALSQSGFQFAYPRVLDRLKGTMDFAVPNGSGDWGVGAFGNPEPSRTIRAVTPTDFSFILVPGVVFGIKGERIGRGGGFFDRYLGNSLGVLRVGFAYDFQVLNHPLNQTPHDARMDFIVTDLRVIELEMRSGR